MNKHPTKTRGRWLRFTIRDLLWLALAVGLVLGWYGDRRKLTALWNVDRIRLVARQDALFAEQAAQQQALMKAKGDLAAKEELHLEIMKQVFFKLMKLGYEINWGSYKAAATDGHVRYVPSEEDPLTIQPLDNRSK